MVDTPTHLKRNSIPNPLVIGYANASREYWEEKRTQQQRRETEYANKIESLRPVITIDAPHQVGVNEVIFAGNPSIYGHKSTIYHNPHAQSTDLPRPKLELSNRAKENVKKGSAIVTKFLEEGKLIYSYNTGFGFNAGQPIPKGEIISLQHRLTRSHASGINNPIYADVPPEYVASMIAARVATLSTGNCGIRLETLQRMIDIFNKGFVPKIPNLGSAGASGDLAPLAHSSNTYFNGEGEFWDFKQQKYRNAKEVLKECGYEPQYTFAAGEGLALMNGVTASTVFGCNALRKGEIAMHAAVIASALSIVANKEHRSPFDPRPNAMRPHKGPIQAAGVVWKLLAADPTDPKITGYEERTDRTQGAYSFRGLTTIMGGSLKNLSAIRETLELELRSVTHNPVIDLETGEVISCSNFHGQPVAEALDLLSVNSVTVMQVISPELEHVLRGESHVGTRPFLAGPGPGKSGYMVPEIWRKLFQHSPVIMFSANSVSTSFETEDHVSRSWESGIQALDLTEKLLDVVALQLTVAVEAIRQRQTKGENVEIPPALQPVFNAVASRFPTLDEDRSLTSDIKNIKMLLTHQPQLFSGLYAQMSGETHVGHTLSSSVRIPTPALAK